MKFVRAVLFVLVFFAPAVTQAAPILPGAPDSLPLLYVCANDACLNLSEAIRRTGEEKVTYAVDKFTAVVLGVAQIDFSLVAYNPDPFITFGVTTTNLTPVPVTYAFLFGTPIVPGQYNVATSTGGLSVTNGLSGTSSVNTSNTYPTYISGYGTLGFVPTNLGVDLGTAPCVAGPGLPLTVTTTCNQGTTTNTFGATFYDNLEALLTYTQTDNLSVASWSGAVTLDFDRTPPVPEPTFLGLLGVAVVGYGMRRRRI